MKKSDAAGIAFLLLFCLAVIFFPLRYGLEAKTLLDGQKLLWTGFEWSKLDNFSSVTREFPYIMGFFKFALLATFGEMLKHRMKTGNWSVTLLPIRALVWGFFGMVMTLAFGLFAGGSGVLMSGNLWFGSNPVVCDTFGNKLIFALSTSVFMNLIFAYPMMLGHEWFSQAVDRRGVFGGEEFLANLNKHAWGSFIPKTIVYFWIPAHTVTFLLPPEFRVLAGAFLSVALGFILTIKSARKA